MDEHFVQGVVGGVLNRHKNRTLDTKRIATLSVEIAANIERATDLEWVVFDKRHLKRANKKKATRRNRRYKNNLMNYLVKKIN